MNSGYIKNLPQKANKSKMGFTMIELLVVISIIVILITMGITSFATAQKKGRDAKRKADLRDFKNALEQYYTTCGLVYPTPSGDSYDPIICFDPVTQGILETMPTDPRSGEAYLCLDPTATNCGEDGYTICANLETDANPYCIKSSQ